MQNNKMKFRSALLVSAATVAAIGLSSVSMNAAEGELETVVVTGSRIPQPNLYSSTPITAVSQDEIKYQGTTSVETMLNTLPSVFAGQTSAASNGATGQASVDLRGIGASRTLVLIDGKRLMPGGPDSGGEVADLNFIPSALVERVEVVTGGASTVYGSDAIAGVVNFMMRKDFEGVEFDLQGGISQHANGDKMMRGILADRGYNAPAGTVWDGENANMTAIFGANTKDGRGNVTAYLGYRVQRAVTQAKRDWSACAAAVNTSTFTSYSCGGSGTIPAGRFKVSGSSAVKVSGTSTSKFTSADAWNYAPSNYLQRPDTRYQGGAFAHYQVSKYLNLTGSFMFMDDHTVAQLAPSGLFYGTDYTVNCDNPYLAQNSSLQSYICGSNAGTTAIATTMIGRRFTEAGARQDDMRHTDYRFVLGANGEILDGFSYDVSAQYATAIYTENFLHDMSTSRLKKALLATTDSSGNIVCQSYISGDDTSCVPINVFTANSLTSDMVSYVEGSGFKQGHTTEIVINANVTADLTQFGVKSPWASSGLALNFGTEYRREELVLKTDMEYQTGDLTGQGGNTPSVSGAFNVSEGFIEGRLPLVSDMPFARDVSVEFGYRYASYNLQGNVGSYKYALDWQVIDDVKLRGSYQRAVRAPNVREMFYPSYLNLWDGADPCSGSSPTYSLAQCQRTGMTAAQYGNVEECSSSQCGGYYGGNKALKPETADTVSLGFVFTPTFINGLTASVDYYRIKVKKLIGTVPESVILEKCATTGDSKWCDLIHRGSDGRLFGQGDGAGYVEAYNTNTGFKMVEGIDLAVNYQFDLEQVGLSNAGSLSTNMTGTLQPRTLTQDYTGGHVYNCSGLFGLTCGTPTPKWRHTLRTTWESPWDFSVSLAWRYFGRVSLDANTSDATLGKGYHDKLDSHISDYNYIDLAGQWAITKGVTVSAGISNILDKDPPVIDSANLGISGPSHYGNGNTYPGVYDALGRTMFVNLTIKL